MFENSSPFKMHATTVVCVRDNNNVVIASDGQVTFGNTILKNTARKVRRLGNGSVIAGFAGATADAFALFERLEVMLEKYPHQLSRACVELAKEWRTDKYLRRLEAMLIVADKDLSFLLSGTGDVIEPEEQVIAIGSGGPYAFSAALALQQNTTLGAQDIALKSLEISGRICIYSNTHFSVEVLDK